MSDRLEGTRRQWSGAAEAYLASPTHARGEDLDRMVTFAAPKSDEVALDLGCGVGHALVRIAAKVRLAVGADATAGMLEGARTLAAREGRANVLLVVTTAEQLPFLDGSFDIVVSRLAAHHFFDPGAAFREVHRVLRPGGRFVLSDNYAPDDEALDRFINTLETLRDPTHVRSNTAGGWRDLIEQSGFDVTDESRGTIRIETEPWLERARTPDAEGARAPARRAAARRRGVPRRRQGLRPPEGRPARRAMSLDALRSVRANEVPLATAAQMAEADRVASTDLGIPLEVLMENAAHQVAVAARAFLGTVHGRSVAAVCGTGNNGGDALGALRHLHGWGARVEAYVAAPADWLRPLAALQHEILTRLGVPLHLATDIDLRDLLPRLRGHDLLLDGLLGYSAKGAPRGEIARLIQAMYAGGRRDGILAVDLPSGIDPDTGANASATPMGVVPAALTVTLALPKPGLLAAEARRSVGELVLADIGIPAKAFAAQGIDAQGVFAEGDLVRIIH